MKLHKIPLEVKPIFDQLRPEISSLHFQSDGTLTCALLFGKPFLSKISLTNKGTQITGLVDLKIDELLEDDTAWGIFNGLRPSLKGDTAFSVLHPGGGPSFLKKIFSKDFSKVTEDTFLKFIVENASSSMAVRHSIVQIQEGHLKVRHYKQPGALMDAAHIGDFIFGLAPDCIFREPYLNSEKRYVLRSDLELNGMIHKQESGYFWFIGKNHKIMRLGLTDNKAIPTTKSLPAGPFSISSCSETDQCLYGVCNAGKTLFRLRNNPVTKEDELQIIKEYSQGTQITALFCLDQEKASQLIFATKTKEGVQFWTMEIKAFEDPEILEDPYLPQELGKLQEDLEEVFQITGDVPAKGNFRVWAGAREKGNSLGIFKLDF